MDLLVAIALFALMCLSVRYFELMVATIVFMHDCAAWCLRPPRPPAPPKRKPPPTRASVK